MSTKEELHHAFKAFKKKLKLYRLDDESKLGGALTPGRFSDIEGIQPPAGFPPGIWDELVAEGKLVREGGGIYSIKGPERKSE
ncbi:MAG: hypothetical protein HYY93_02985 [Planctomycetes bacterium]|nr:hypothetical protein [Planctomycetota bacterium]